MLQASPSVDLELTGPPTPELVVQLLIRNDKLSIEEAERAKTLAQSSNANIWSVLDRLGFVSQRDWIDEIAHLLDLRIFTGDDFQSLDLVDQRISLDFMRKRLVLPINDNGQITLIISDPWDEVALKGVVLSFGEEMDLMITTPREIEAIVSRLEKWNREGNGALSLLADAEESQYLLEIANEAPTIRAVENIFSDAFQISATDIHVEPLANTGRVRFRKNGVLIEGTQIALDMYQGVISRLKILADMDIAERRRPQDGRMAQRYQGKQYDIRVASLPTIHGEALSLRVLAQSDGLVSVEQLNLPRDVKTIVDWSLTQRNGLIVVTGPTGSGKTTTLYSALTQLNDVGKKILTVENPVEIRLKGALQVETHREIGLDFANVLKSFLRHDPDILMIGEIRDAETANVAIQAALTGRLVFSTLHTNSAEGAVHRLIDLGCEPFLVSNVLRASIAQRLVRVLCDECAVKYAEIHGPGPAMHLDEEVINDTSKMREAQGCAQCSDTGYARRTAIFEALGQDQIENAIEKQPVTAPSLLDHGKILIEQGITTQSEVARILDGRLY